MRFQDSLRKFNAISFAVLSVLAIVGLGMALFQVIQSWRAEGDFEARAGSYSDNMEIIADKVQTKNRSLALYWTRLDDSERKRDIRFVDMHDGATYRVSNDPRQIVIGFEILRLDQDPRSMAFGYTAMLRTGGTESKPLFDVVVGRFDDNKQFTVGRNMSRLQFPTMIDEKTLSMVLWDRGEMATFVLFDIRSGQIVVNRSLEMTDPRGFSTSQAPPQNKFH